MSFQRFGTRTNISNVIKLLVIIFFSCFCMLLFLGIFGWTVSLAVLRIDYINDNFDSASKVGALTDWKNEVCHDCRRPESAILLPVDSEETLKYVEAHPVAFLQACNGTVSKSVPENAWLCLDLADTVKNYCCKMVTKEVQDELNDAKILRAWSVSGLVIGGLCLLVLMCSLVVGSLYLLLCVISPSSLPAK